MQRDISLFQSTGLANFKVKSRDRAIAAVRDHAEFKGDAGDVWWHGDG